MIAPQPRACIDIAPPLAAKVFTFVGLPPTPCFLERLRVTADLISALDIFAAVAAGTHLGYFRFVSLVLLRPHFSNPPPFLGAPMSTQLPLLPFPNHSVKPPFGLATGHSRFLLFAGQHATKPSRLNHH